MKVLSRNHWVCRYAIPAAMGGALIMFTMISLLVYCIVDSQSDDPLSSLMLLQNGARGVGLSARRHMYDSIARNARKAIPPSPPSADDNEEEEEDEEDEEEEEEATPTPRHVYEKQNRHLVSDMESIEARVEKMRLPQRRETVAADDLDYDIHRCPADIPEGYPVQWSIIDVLSHWNPDDMDIPSHIYQGLCTIDWKDSAQRKIGKHYRNHELPFLVKNNPEIWKTAERWSHYDYLASILKENEFRNEHSLNNHMMYWKLRGNKRKNQPPPKPKGWKPPTENVELTYEKWYKHAQELEQITNVTQVEHWYFRLNGDYGHRNEFLFDEFPMFRPTKKNFFMVEPDDGRGINCRFGSKGIIAETHYDFSRNFIFILGGQKRYILAHPNQCRNMELYPQQHPSARHSRINWSDPNDWHTGRFHKAHVNEVVLEAGDALYLPTAWFHFIVSLNFNYQCNARSGTTFDYAHDIDQCGFGTK